MWLLDTSTLQLEYFQTADHVKYAILSHTWDFREVTFQDMKLPPKEPNCGWKQVVQPMDTRSMNKIKGCCAQAKSDGYSWAWIDTCCIDKTSSAELTEAINSMYAWYKNSAVCYVLLQDVSWFNPSIDDPVVNMRHSRWFSRGWTLQELLAPNKAKFFSRDWKAIGNKSQLRPALAKITGIAPEALMPDPILERYNVAERMSWAANRQTTRVEDIAYSLLGIFDVNMPMIYGEGKKAFRRLQEQILENTEDHTIFAWQCRFSDTKDPPLSMLADSPACFCPGPKVDWTYADLQPFSSPTINESASSEWFRGDPARDTPRGIRLALPFIASPNTPDFGLAIIGYVNCGRTSNQKPTGLLQKCETEQKEELAKSQQKRRWLGVSLYGADIVENKRSKGAAYRIRAPIVVDTTSSELLPELTLIYAAKHDCSATELGGVFKSLNSRRSTADILSVLSRSSTR